MKCELVKDSSTEFQQILWKGFEVYGKLHLEHYENWVLLWFNMAENQN
jgi:hypothetical protein